MPPLAKVDYPRGLRSLRPGFESQHGRLPRPAVAVAATAREARAIRSPTSVEAQVRGSTCLRGPWGLLLMSRSTPGGMVLEEPSGADERTPVGNDLGAGERHPAPGAHPVSRLQALLLPNARGRSCLRRFPSGGPRVAAFTPNALVRFRPAPPAREARRRAGTCAPCHAAARCHGPDVVPPRTRPAARRGGGERHESTYIIATRSLTPLTSDTPHPVDEPRAR